jgi:hypothetical protein
LLQLFGSVCVSVHPDWQQTSTPMHAGPPLQVAVQLPLLHVSPWEHWSPHCPQLSGSVVKLTQACPASSKQQLSGAGHAHSAGWQFPPTHSLSGGHSNPHWLQLFGSV